MISDASLNTLAIFLGSLAVLMIILYHFLEVNARDSDSPSTDKESSANVKTPEKVSEVAAGSGSGSGKKGAKR